MSEQYFTSYAALGYPAVGCGCFVSWLNHPCMRMRQERADGLDCCEARATVMQNKTVGKEYEKDYGKGGFIGKRWADGGLGASRRERWRGGIGWWAEPEIFLGVFWRGPDGRAAGVCFLLFLCHRQAGDGHAGLVTNWERPAAKALGEGDLTAAA